MRVLNDADRETAELILRLHLEDIEAAEADQWTDSESDNESTADSDDASHTDTDNAPLGPDDLRLEDLDARHPTNSPSAASSIRNGSDFNDDEHGDQASVVDGDLDGNQDVPIDNGVQMSSNSGARNSRSIRALTVDGELMIVEVPEPEMDRDASSVRSRSLPVSKHEDEQSNDDDGDSETEDDNSEHDDADLGSDEEEEDEEDEPESQESSSESEDLSDHVSETSSLAEYAERSGVEEQPCIICGKMCCKSVSCLLGCGHYHCRTCLNHAFRLALRDRSSYPPRCCSTDSRIPFDQARPILDSELADAFENKQEELDDANPTYCFKSSCSSYIPESFKEGAMGMCKECSSDTCILCRQQWHTGDCLDDEQIAQTLRLAKDLDWQKCPGCQRIVELTFGCNHVT